MTLFLTSTNEAAIIAAEAQISANCGFPNGRGTERWAVPQKAINEDLWFIIKPSVNGYSDTVEAFTQEQTLAGVDLSGVTEQEVNPDWFPIDEDI